MLLDIYINTFRIGKNDHFNCKIKLPLFNHLHYKQTKLSYILKILLQINANITATGLVRTNSSQFPTEIS